MTITDSSAIHIFRRGADGPADRTESFGDSCYDPRADASGRIATGTVPPMAPRAQLDQQLCAILDSPRGAGETVAAQFARKEHQLASILASLTVGEALAMHRRLATPRTGDALALQFSRLVADRRARLLRFLAEAPRRAAR